MRRVSIGAGLSGRLLHLVCGRKSIICALLTSADKEE